MYSSLYDWNRGGYPGFSKYLEKLYYISYQKDNHQTIEDFLNHLETYFYELIRMGFVTVDNYEFIMNRMEMIQKVHILPKNMDRHYAFVKNQDVYLNPSINGKYGLSNSSFQLMVHSHEIGHLINHGWREEAKRFTNTIGNIRSVKDALEREELEPKHIFYGFQLLDEVVTQEVSERVTYQSICRERPKFSKRTDKRIFNFQPYVTNYSIYGEFQEFAEKFARNLDFLNCKDDDKLEVLRKLSMASFRPDFIKKIEDEMYHNPKKVYPLIMMLAVMGRVKEATYQLVGEECSENDDFCINSYLPLFQEMSNTKTDHFTYRKK
ncbi:MAG: hypothetical protein IKE70_00315 [Bacilli bacterium]|nr:hypothetical protein [Bacilli bacterium]